MVSPDSYALIGIALTSGSGFVLGLLGWWSNRHKDDADHATAVSVAEATATDVATRASQAAVEVMQKALDVAAQQIADLTVKVDQIPALRAEIAGLRVAHEECEGRNATLTVRVRELEMAR